MKKFMLRRDTSANTASQTTTSSKKKDKDEFVPPPPSALENMLARAGPVKEDGSDKFFGYENSPPQTLRKALDRSMKHPTPESIREDLAPPPKEPKQSNPTSRNSGAVTQPPHKPEDKNSSEYKKRVAMATLPILNTQDNSRSYGMQESLFTALKDLFESIVASKERMGVLKPQRFLEVLRRDYEMFRTAMHQDAHEFLNILLNEVVTNVESDAVRSGSSDFSDVNSDKGSEHSKQSSSQSSSQSLEHSQHHGATGGGKSSSNMIRWVHELFEGILTSETKCLTCEKKSQRDEVFLDLSVDLEQYSSVTSCLRKFSAEEMLCERDKFHCDNCGGLQEAEKRMIIKRLPRILALHLKRFKYTEDLQRLQKLFHCVAYPYYLRLFNTTDDAEDPDRLYELYAVVVHIGGGPHHGHYVSIIKTEEYGWFLFDDELVEPVDKNYVRNFFGDKPGLACAYVLFYQETTMEKMQRDQELEALREYEAQAAETSATAAANGTAAGGGGGGEGPMSTLHRVTSWQRRESSVATAASPFPVFDRDRPTKQNGSPAGHVPAVANGLVNGDIPNISEGARRDSYTVAHEQKNPSAQTVALDTTTAKEARRGESSSKKERAKEEKERKAADKADKEREKEREKAEKQKRKEAEARMREAQKRQEMELKAALEASRQSKLEEDRKAKEKAKEDASVHGGLTRFRINSKSFGLSVKTHHLKEKEKDRGPKTAHPSSKNDKGSFDDKKRRVSSFNSANRFKDDFESPPDVAIGTPVAHSMTYNNASGPSQLNGIDSVLHENKNINRASTHANEPPRANSQPGYDMQPFPNLNNNNNNHHGNGALHSLRSTSSFLHSSPKRDSQSHSQSGNSSGTTVDEFGGMLSPKSPPITKRSRFSFRKKSSLY
ncbi:hypothetical protein KEM56_000224 [Ascosphaera pollenicola]|nr:hypothetical protein KEM56_000224 [Ascosphaera pollenicola]